VESKLGPLCTSATEWPIVPTPGDYDDGEFGGMKIGRENRSTRRKPAPAPLCPPQIPLHQTRARTRPAAVGSQRLTAWAMARPNISHTQNVTSYSYRILFGKPEGKRPSERPRRERTILKCILQKQDRVVWTRLIWLRPETTEVLWWTRYWTFVLDKMLGNSWVV
jgi:hypothetical protein